MTTPNLKIALVKEPVVAAIRCAICKIENKLVKLLSTKNIKTGKYTFFKRESTGALSAGRPYPPKGTVYRWKR